MTDIAERLTKVERDQSHPNLKPRDAATLILVDRSGAQPKVLLGKRHAGLKFMAGKFVFPAAAWSRATATCRSRATSIRAPARG